MDEFSSAMDETVMQAADNKDFSGHVVRSSLHHIIESCITLQSYYYYICHVTQRFLTLYKSTLVTIKICNRVSILEYNYLAPDLRWSNLVWLGIGRVYGFKDAVQGIWRVNELWSLQSNDGKDTFETMLFIVSFIHVSKISLNTKRITFKFNKWTVRVILQRLS